MDFPPDVRELQRAVCVRHGVTASPPHPSEKIGIALGTLSLRPLNGLRHPPEAGTCGWYVWGGEQFSTTDDFFQPLHVAHLHQTCSEVLPFLALPPGWRFLVDGGYEDAWYDETLLGPGNHSG